MDSDFRPRRGGDSNAADGQNDHLKATTRSLSARLAHAIERKRKADGERNWVRSDYSREWSEDLLESRRGLQRGTPSRLKMDATMSGLGLRARLLT